MEENKQQNEMQQAYMELQMVNQQIKQNQQQTQAVDEQTNELIIAIDNLNELKNTKKGSKMLVPLTQGIFAKASLIDNDEVVVNVGAGTSVKKDVDATKMLLEDQLKNIRDVKIQITSNTEQLMASVISIEKRIEQLIPAKK